MIVTILLVIINIYAMSQKEIEGEYAFRKTEMIAGFNFTAISAFQFFFSYGAVNRADAGTFTVEGKAIKLTSNKEAGKDFTITAQSREASGYTISFNHPKNYLLQNIRCIFLVNGKQEEAVTNSNGELHVDFTHCDIIYVQHLL